MKRLPLFRREVFWIPLLFAVATVAVQAYRITSKPSVYDTIGRVVVEERVVQANSSRDGLATTSYPPVDFMGAQIEWLESAELKHRTMNRVRSLYPELEEAPVEIRVTQTKGSFILNVRATGGEPKYTRSYLDALLEEYQSSCRKIDTPTYQTAIMDRAKVAVKIIPDLWAPLMLAAILGLGIGNFFMRFIAKPGAVPTSF